jgi:hypothetical protein
MLLLLLGCHTIEKIQPTVYAGPTDACEGRIYAPLSGFSADDPVLADADAEEYGPAPRPYQVHLSWAEEPSTSMAVVWRTDIPTLATQVEYGPDTSYGSVAAGRSFLFGAAGAENRAHEAHLCDLSPGTTYHYRVGGAGGWSADHTFTTAPAPGEDATIRFAVSGDSRGAQDTWALVLQAMDAHAPDFYVFSGDAVDIGVDMDEWNAWFEAGEGHIDTRPVMVAEGNHELQTQEFYAQFALPGNEQWFSFDYGPAHFVFLNDTVADPGDLQTQAAWMGDDLAATDAKWRFAVHHQPAYSSCTTHGPNTTLQQVWSPVEEAGNVAIDFAGHNHNYERSVPLRGGLETTTALGTTYMVTAGAGADLYGNDLSQPYTAVAAVTENFAIVEVSGDTTTMTAYDLAGNVLDTLTITR